MMPFSRRFPALACLALTCIVCQPWTFAAPQVLVLDRPTSRVLSYDAGGNFMGVVLHDTTNLDEPVALTLSPDRTQLYIATRAGNSVVRYDFNGTTGSNPHVIISSGVSSPAALQFSADGSKLYVANLGAQNESGFDGSTVSQFDPNGASAGPDLVGAPTGRSGLALNSHGELLVSAYGEASVYKLNSNTQALEAFVGPDFDLFGAAHLLVHNDGLYVSGAVFGTAKRFNALTGVEDPTFGVIGLELPSGFALAPDGETLLIAELGPFGSVGTIGRYDFAGTLLEEFAPNSATDPNQGFIEATALLTVFDSADFDVDGDVDGVDLDIWELAYGVNDSGDADFDGDSDGNDFLIWQCQTPQSFATLQAVPEPTTVALFVAALTVCRRRLRKSARN